MCKVTTAERLKEWMEKTGSRQVDILERAKPFCKKYGVKLTKSALSQYISGKSEPHQDKLFILGCALNVDEAWLMGYPVAPERKHSDASEHFNAFATDFNERRNKRIIDMRLSDSELAIIQRYRNHDESEIQPFYLDRESAEIAEEVFHNPELRMLFKASRDVKPESIKLAAEMLKQMKSTNPDG